MSRSSPSVGHATRLLVVIPNWVGDVVLASPVLRALREQLPHAHIGYALRPYVTQVLDGSGWYDALHPWRAAKGVGKATGLLSAVRSVAADRYDAALLLTNAFRAALITRLAGIPTRIGYDRDARGWMLTDRLTPLKRGREFVPVPMIPYYARLAARVGVQIRDPQLSLGVTAEQEAAGRQLLDHYGLASGGYVAVNTGAAFGASKCWLPARFAATCDAIQSQLGLKPVLVGAPGELPLMRSIADQAQQPVTVMHAPGTTLGSLKVIVRESAALLCNDTGPRHYAIAFGRPVVTIFGPTHPEWTDTHYASETIVQRRVPCGPCQLKRCPLDHRCMRAVTVEDVIRALKGRLEGAGGGSPRGTLAPAACLGARA